jgi:hypothetical protein
MPSKYTPSVAAPINLGRREYYFSMQLLLLNNGYLIAIAILMETGMSTLMFYYTPNKVTEVMLIKGLLNFHFPCA